MALAMSEEALGIFVPLLAYWAYAGMYEVMGCICTEKYRLYPREDEEKNNLISRWETLKGVLFNQICQVAFSFMLFWIQGKSNTPMVQPPLYVQAVQLLVAILVFDAWQYFGHRFFHTNTFMYKYIHAQHHHLVVPYSYGAQYQHPIEALLLDTLGAAVSYAVAGMTPRTGMFYFSLVLMKTVDDHSGLWLPKHPFHKVFSNNSAFHTVHHQLYGGKSNFCAPFFTFWDKIFGTYMPYTLEKKEGGGFQLKPVKKD